MSPSEDSLFAEALERTSNPERAAYLDQVCAGNPQLRARIEVLLAAHDDPDPFLEPLGRRESAAMEQPGPTETVGSQIGPYKLMERIAEGGMGMVYVAEQTKPVRRKVALKIIKPGMDTRQVVARFEAERQALAMMEHPNIAKVFDGGATESGRPYFVMELVRGIPITDYCDKHQLDTRQRLDLFISVCQAVQHAHQKGVIHRDIKPSNVMVAHHDTQPVPKIIDFGVAKATCQRLTDKTVYTQFSQMIGTPLYMSPEQAEMSGLDVDTRTDIYSLGVLLYELLTGTTPFDIVTLKNASYDEVRRIIREDEPPMPSVRISTLEASLQSTISHRRDTDKRRLSQTVQGELDWIVMKTLEKDRNRRYETANALAADMQRYLSDDPVEACPPSRAYRLRKFVRRNKVALSAATVVAIALIAGTVGTSWQALRAMAAEGTAKRRLIVKELAVEQARAATLKAEQVAISERAARDETEKAKQAVEALYQRTRRLLYTSDMGLAQQEWENANLGNLLNLLNRHRPTSAESDLRGFEWYYFWRLCHGYSKSLETDATIWSVAYSPDGNLLATGGGWLDKPSELILWDSATGHPKHVLDGHTDYVKCVAFSPDGKTLASGSSDATIKLWDVATQKLKATLEGHVYKRNGTHHYPQGVESIAFSPNGQLLASGGADRTVRLWEVGSGRLKATLKGHESLYVSSVVFSPDGKTLASAGWDKTVRLWDVPTGQLRATLRGHGDYVWCVAFSPDGTTVASTGCDGTVKLWDATTGKPTATFQGHKGYVSTVAFSPGGKLLASGGSLDRTVRLWDVPTGKLAGIIKGHANPVWSVAFSYDGRTLASGSGDRTVKLWDLTTIQAHPRTDSHTDRIMSVAFSPDGKKVASSSWDTTVKVWDLATGQPERTLRGHNNIVSCVIFSPDGQTLASTGSWDRTIRLWDVMTGEPKATFEDVRATQSVAFSPDGKMLASSGHDPIIKLWELATGRLAMKLARHKGHVRSVAFSSDGKTLASGSNDQMVKFWDVATGALKQTLDGHAGTVRCVAFSPDDATLASASFDGTVRLWDVATGEVKTTLKAHADGVYSVAFSPDGRTLASASTDRTVRLWDVETYQLRATIKADDALLTIAFSPDGQTLALGGLSGNVEFWHAPRTED